MWWLDIIVVIVLLSGIYAFLTLVGFHTRWFARRTRRSVDSMYESYEDSTRQQRRYARRQGGAWRENPAPGDPGDRPR